MRKLGSKSAFFKDTDEFIQGRLEDRNDVYARTQGGGIGYRMQNHARVEGGGRLEPVAGRNLGEAGSELLGDPHAKGDVVCRNPRQAVGELGGWRFLRHYTSVETRQRQTRGEREDRILFVSLPLRDMLGELPEGGDEALVRDAEKIVVCLHLGQRD